jgi:hypothetical protein
MGYEVPQQITVTQDVNVYCGAAAAADKVDGVGVLLIPANSGGIILSSGEIVGVSVKALASNSGDIYVGGPTNLPYSGYGFCLKPGEAWNIDVKNLNNVSLVSIVSGDLVTWGALK